jgi:phosphatidylinositol-3-phosphatase
VTRWLSPASRTRRAPLAAALIAAVCGLAALACGANKSGARAPVARSDAGAPCGAQRRPPARYSHVIWIIFENQSAADVIGNHRLPYINRIARRCGLATRFFAEAHPSLPNYIAMTSGGTQGVTNDDSGPLSADNIYAQVKRSGRGWRHYAFGMSTNCDHRDSPSSDRAIYTAHHQSAIFFRNIARDCARWDVGVGNPAKVVDPNDVRNGPLARALDTDRLPAFATLEPTDDGGNSSAGGEVDPVKGNAFLARWIPRITRSAAYRRGGTAIFITWDEPNDFDVNPPRQTIATIVIAPTVRAGVRVGTRFNHYAMLRTTEELLGLRPFLGGAANATSMRSGFHF